MATMHKLSNLSKQLPFVQNDSGQNREEKTEFEIRHRSKNASTGIVNGTIPISNARIQGSPISPKSLSFYCIRANNNCLPSLNPSPSFGLELTTFSAHHSCSILSNRIVEQRFGFGGSPATLAPSPSPHTTISL